MDEEIGNQISRYSHYYDNCSEAEVSPQRPSSAKQTFCNDIIRKVIDSGRPAKRLIQSYSTSKKAPLTRK